MLQSFMDLQFPNGQLTYVAGEGISTSAFLPVFGGLLQAQGQYPGEMKFSFSCKVSYYLLRNHKFSFSYTFLIWKSVGRINGEHGSHPWFNGLQNHLLWVLSKLWLGKDLGSWWGLPCSSGMIKYGAPLAYACFVNRMTYSFFFTSLQPTLGGNNPGLKAELVHSIKEELSLIGGCSLVSQPSAFASLSVSFLYSCLLSYQGKSPK